MQAETPAPATLGDYDRWWFSTRCKCNRVYVPVRMLLEDGMNLRHTVIEVASLLRCKSQCGERPFRVELVPDARCNHKGEMFRVPGKKPVLLVGDASSATAPNIDQDLRPTQRNGATEPRRAVKAKENPE